MRNMIIKGEVLINKIYLWNSCNTVIDGNTLSLSILSKKVNVNFCTKNNRNNLIIICTCQRNKIYNFMLINFRHSYCIIEIG